MAKSKKSHKKPQNKAQNKAQNRAQNVQDNELKKAFAQTPTTQSKPLLLRIFILALVALLVLGVVVMAIGH